MNAYNWEVVGEEDISEAFGRLWVKAVSYLIRLAKKKVFWWANGQALRFLSERRNYINRVIDAELAARRHHGDQ